MTAINKHTYCISALQRSGHHPVINWIIANNSTNAVFLNNCYPGINPYSSFNTEDSHIENIDLEKEKTGHFSEKSVLIFNYEDKSLSSIFSAAYIENKQNWIGKSLQEFNIIILRVPYNNFASKYNWAINGKTWAPTLESIKLLPDLWKSYAKEMIGISNIVPEQKLFINYNRWFSDPIYRDQLANQLFLGSSEKGLKEVAKWGPNTWGDSFDNLKFDGKANEMKVLERWKAFSNDKFYKSLFGDRELIELSDTIFGEIPGTDILINN